MGTNLIIGMDKEEEAVVIDEAIRVDTVLKDTPILRDDQKVIDALSLSIEALETIKRIRADRRFRWPPKLPGETPE